MGARKMLKLLLIAVRDNMSSHLARPGDLLLSTLGSLMNNCLYVYGIYLIASISLSGEFHNINIFFIATGLITTAWGLVNLLFGGLAELGGFIESGELESFLATPKHPLLLTAMAKSNISCLAELLQGLIVITYLGLSLGAIFALKMLMGVCIAAIALLGVVIIGGSLSFFSQRGNSISALFIQTTLSMSLFPMGSVLKSHEKWILYLSPLVFSSFLPIQFITKGDISWFILGFIGSILFFMSSLYFFKIGVTNYRAANFIRLSR